VLPLRRRHNVPLRLLTAPRRRGCQVRPTVRVDGSGRRLAAPAAGQGGRAIPRTPDGRPDLTGIYDTNHITPLERPVQFGDRRALTAEEAAALERGAAERAAKALEPSDPNRPAPPVSKNPGAYSTFWTSPGSRVVRINGEKRTSIIIDPPDGRIPPMTPEGRARDEALGGIIMRPDIVESTIAVIPAPPSSQHRPGAAPAERALSARVRMELGHADPAELHVQQPEADRSDAH